jgi:hypothetical protein
MPIPDTDFDPIFEGEKIQWGIKDGLYTISGEILSANKEPQSEKFLGKDSVGNINRKVWHGRHLQYTIEAVIAQELEDSALPGEGDQILIDGYTCLCDGGSKIAWVQDGETKVSLTAHYFPHMTLNSAQ